MDITYEPPPVSRSHVHRLYVLFALILLLIVAFLLGSSSNNHQTHAATVIPSPYPTPQSGS